MEMNSNWSSERPPFRADRVNATVEGYVRVTLVSPAGEPVQSGANSQQLDQIFTDESLFYYALTVLSAFQIYVLGQIFDFCVKTICVSFNMYSHLKNNIM